MAKCDLCGESCPSLSLEQLMPQYHVDGVQDICPACSSWATKQKSELIDQIAPQMRARISLRLAIVKRPGFWSRLFSRRGSSVS